MRGKKLARQIKKILGLEDLDTAIGALLDSLQGQDTFKLPESVRITIEALKSFPELLDSIEAAYFQSEKLIEQANRSLEVSSAELSVVNKSIKTLMDSLGQGFLVFNKDGICGHIYSKACLDLLETDPISKPIVEVLKVPESKREDFRYWIGILFNGPLEFEEAVWIGPKTFIHSKSKHVTLEFKPIRNDCGNVDAVVMVATDTTAEVQAAEETAKKQQYVEMILKISTDRNHFFSFVKKTREIIGIFRSANTQGVAFSLWEARLLIHTLKGGAAAFFMADVRDLAHKFETELSLHFENGKEKADQKLTSKIVLCGIELEKSIDSFLDVHRGLLGNDFEKEGYVKRVKFDHLLKFSDDLEHLPGSEELVSNFFHTFVNVPISQFFLRFNSVMQQIASSTGKVIKPIQFSGDDVRILPQAYEDFFAATVHIFTNIAVHGVESTTERGLKGKDPHGTVRVHVRSDRAFPESPSWLLIDIEDDGAGIDPETIRKKLVSQGYLKEDVITSDSDLIQHIFDGGFSSLDQVTGVAGRGVGLSAVKEAVIGSGGKIAVTSSLGQKTTFHIELPCRQRPKTP